MKQKVRLIYTICHQDGIDHWSQGFVTVDAEIDLPTEIHGRKLREFSFVGLEFVKESGDE